MMKKPVVNYKEFRLRKLNDPQFSHLKLLLGWVGYFLLYFITENLIPAERCVPIHGALDDMIPFCEYFVIPYTLWYVLVAGTLLIFALYDIPSFRMVSKYIIVTQVLAMTIYIIFPNRQDLRPAEFPRENVFTWVLSLIYSFDTSTNVCPSLHVAYSLGIASVWMKRKESKLWIRLSILAFSLLVCVSVAFVKQHSVVDIYAAIPVCLVAEVIACLPYYKARRKEKKTV